VPFAFVALKVAVKLPEALGVPVIAPVDAFNTNGEIEPLTIDQVIGDVPVATRESEYADPAIPENKT
jgi:hypothetical protein